MVRMQSQDGGWLLKAKVTGRGGERENDGLNTDMAVGVSGDAEEAEGFLVILSKNQIEPCSTDSKNKIERSINPL